MIDAFLPHLTPDSTLAEFPSYEFEVDLHTLGHQVAEEFERRPEVPGVIVRQDGERMRLVSRQSFFHLISQPFGRELYLKRPWYSPWKRVLDLDWPVEHSEDVFKATQAMHEKLTEATGGRALPNPMWGLLRSLLTLHPLGGCRMGDTAATGVVDHLGRVHGYPVFVDFHSGRDRICDGRVNCRGGPVRRSGPHLCHGDPDAVRRL